MMKRLFGSGWLGASRDPLASRLGHLEAAIMEIVWNAGDLLVRDVQARLARPVAYTTVMTTLDRLFKKGFVLRHRLGRAFVYRAAFDKSDLEADLTSGLLTELLSNRRGAATPVLSNLVDTVAESDDRLLDELERLVRDKRERLRRGDR